MGQNPTNQQPNMGQQPMNNQQPYQGMPQNPNMMNPQFQGYNQGKSPSKLGLKLKELGMKIKQDKKMAIISAVVVTIIILVGGYLYHTRYNRELANHEFYVTLYDKNGKEDESFKENKAIWQFRKKDLRGKWTIDGEMYIGKYTDNKYKVDGNKFTLTNIIDGKAYKSKAIISKSGKDIKITGKNGEYTLLHKIK